MVESGDWLTPHFNYEPRFQKPALYYWLTAATFARDRSDRVRRALWSALRGSGPRAGHRGVRAPVVRREHGAARRRDHGDQLRLLRAWRGMALPDLPLDVLRHAGDLRRVRRRRSNASAIRAAGCCSPRQRRRSASSRRARSALVIPRAGRACRCCCIERRSFDCRASATSCWPRWSFCAIAAPWYVGDVDAARQRLPRGVLRRRQLRTLRDRRASTIRGRGGSICRCSPAACCRGRRSRSSGCRPIWQFLTRRRDIGTLDLRLLLWAVLPLVFFTLSVGKQPRYILPVLPPVAMLLAGSIIERTREWRSHDGARVAAAPESRRGRRLRAGGPVPRRAGGAALPRAEPVRRCRRRDHA